MIYIGGMDHEEDKTTSGFKQRSYVDYLNYFGKDRTFHLWFAEKRTKVISVIFPPFVRLGLVPDTISYIGISLLAGVVFYFLRRPLLAALFLAGHVICDGLDGAYARHTNKASQAGAFTDLVCDQLGMVVVSLMAILHHMVYPVLGAVYMTLYLIVVVFGVIINVMGLGSRVTVTSKYILYIVYLLWAGWKIDLFTLFMSLFSIIMAVEVLIGYLRLKRGIRRKFDSEVRYAEGDQYSGRLNYALNVAVPILTFLAILLAANWVPLQAMFDHPKIRVNWIPGAKILTDEETVRGLGGDATDLYVMVSTANGALEIKRYEGNSAHETESFVVPEHIEPALSVFPVDGNTLLVADSVTRLLMGFDLKASFAAKKAVINLTLPLEYLRITAMAKGMLENRPVWFAANHLYTRKTYIVDPVKAIKKSKLLGGVIGGYVNGGFPSGMAVSGDYVLEYNNSPLRRLIYVAPLATLLDHKPLPAAARVSFTPPTVDAMGPVIQSDFLLMLTPTGQIYKLALQPILGSH